MKTYHIAIMIQITPTTDTLPYGVTEGPDGQFHSVITVQEATSIDACEQALLAVNYPALRHAMAEHFTAVSREQAEAQPMNGTIWNDLYPYRVDSEVGRFEFVTHWIEDPSGACVYDTAREAFSPLGSTERYLTQGYKELAMVAEAATKSYRKGTTTFNRFRHQEEGGTPMRTLRDQTEREGACLQNAIDQQVTQILEAHEIPRSGALTQMPHGVSVPMDPTLPGERSIPDLIQTCALAAAQENAPATTDLRDNPVPYESPATTVNICIDDVGTKRQKATRFSAQDDANTADPPKTVQHTVAHVEQGGRRYILAGYGVVATLRMVLALLLQSACAGYRLQFFVDGQRSLQTAIERFFAWHPAVALILDWYHLRKKCANQLSLAMRGRKVRNTALKPLLHLLWYGLVDQAITAIKALDQAQIKNPQEVTRLIGYLERNRPNIPCYAVRKRLGLRNSSQLGEKMNDIVVAERQKRRGMSWSVAGSTALASLTALVQNGEVARWFNEGTLHFKLAA